MTPSAFLRLGRVSNLPTVWTNVLCGIGLARGTFDKGTLPLLVAFSLFYTGGMFLNDAFDRRFDAHNRPERPIPSGLASAREVFLVGFGMVALAIGMIAPRGLEASLLAILLAATITVYDAWHKENKAAPFLMGLCRMLVYLAAGVASGGSMNRMLVACGLMLMAYVAGLTQGARRDSAAGRQSPWSIVFLLAPLACVAIAWTDPVVLLVGAVFVHFAGKSILGREAPSESVGRLVAAISLVDALFLAARGETFMAGIAVLGVPATLSLQRRISGT
ncbi:MAG: UbiA family prenyltransferase [Deltaproteobacteria bacterium]|nr:UbiA family prenyltransferase [Deltaproteobacteria bacterium]